MLVVPETSVRLSQLVQELAAAQLVRTSTPELQSDPVARTELDGRIQELDRQVASEVGRAFDPRRSEWFIGGEGLEVSSWWAVIERPVRAVRCALLGCAPDPQRAAELAARSRRPPRVLVAI